MTITLFDFIKLSYDKGDCFTPMTMVTFLNIEIGINERSLFQFYKTAYGSIQIEFLFFFRFEFKNK